MREGVLRCDIYLTGIDGRDIGIRLLLPVPTR